MAISSQISSEKKVMDHREVRYSCRIAQACVIMRSIIENESPENCTTPPSGNYNYVYRVHCRLHMLNWKLIDPGFHQ